MLLSKNNHAPLLFLSCICCLITLPLLLVNAKEYIDPSDWQQFLPSKLEDDADLPALLLHATAFRRDSPNEIGGTTYDEHTELWHGINEDSIMTTFRPNWKPLVGNIVEGYYNVEGPSSNGGDGTVDIVETQEIQSDFIVKGEGIVSAPNMCRLGGLNLNAASAYKEDNDTSSSSSSSSSLFTNNDPQDQRASLFTNSASPQDSQESPNREYWIVSESNSITAETNSYFSKRHGQPDLNTFKPNSLEHSRVVRVSSSGELLEEIQLPPWMYWDGVFDWDPMKCYGTRVYKGLHDLTVWEVGRADYLKPEGGDTGSDGSESSGSDISKRRRLDDDATIVHDNTTQLITINQCALYQDGGEPNLFDGSHLRIMFWDVRPEYANGADDDDSCRPSIDYSRSYRYQTARLQISTLQKGAVHTHAVFGVLAISPLELLVAEVEFLEGFGVEEYVSDVFYVKYAPPTRSTAVRVYWIAASHIRSNVICYGGVMLWN